MLTHYSLVIEKEESWFVAHCVELGITSQGKSIEDARNNIQEAIELYIESFSGDKDDLVYDNEKYFFNLSLEVPVNA